MAILDNGTKWCHKCSAFKPADDFGNNRARPDGKNVYCRECTKPISRANFEKNREYYRAKGREWYAAHPDVRLEQAKRDYVKRKDKILADNLAWRLLNKKQQAEYRKRYRAENPELHAALHRGYKARKRGATGKHTADDIKEIFKAQRGKCAYCKASLRSGYHADHIKSLRKGGSNERSNIQLTCQSCNLRKKDIDPIEFAKKIGLLI